MVEDPGDAVAGDRAGDCSTDGADPPVRWWVRLPARSGYVVAGVVYGLLVTTLSGGRDEPQWLVWATLAVTLTAASGVVFGYGLAQWPAVAGPDRVRVRQVLPALGALAAVGAAMLAVSTVLAAVDGDGGGRPAVDVVGLSLTMFAIAGTVPVAADLAAVRQRTLLPPPESPGRRAEELLALRQSMSGFLHAGGALVALATLALGAAVRSGDGQNDNLVVVVFGANMSVLLALAYAPAAAAVRSNARRLAAAAVPLADTTAADLPNHLDARQRLEQALGADRGLLADLQSDLVILAPLLAAGAAAFLPR